MCFYVIIVWTEQCLTEYLAIYRLMLLSMCKVMSKYPDYMDFASTVCLPLLSSARLNITQNQIFHCLILMVHWLANSHQKTSLALCWIGRNDHPFKDTEFKILTLMHNCLDGSALYRRDVCILLSSILATDLHLATNGDLVTSQQRQTGHACIWAMPGGPAVLKC